MNETIAPDPSWVPAQMLSAALAAEELSAAWFAPLAALDTSTLSDSKLMDLAVVTHRLLSVAEAMALASLAAVPVQRCGPDTSRSACSRGVECAHHWEADEFAVMTRESLNAVRRRQRLASQLVRPRGAAAALPHGTAPHPHIEPRAGALSRVMPLLATGQVSSARVATLARAVAHRDSETCEAVLDRVLPKMPQQTPPAFAKAVQRAVDATTSPTDAAVTAHAARRIQTGVRMRPLDHGLAAMTVTAPVEVVEAVLTVLRSHPAGRRATADREGTTGEHQVSRLLNLVLHDGSCIDRRPPARPRVGVIVTVAAEVLAGLSNEPGLVGATPVHAELTRQLVEEQGLFFRLAVLDHRGVAIDLGRSHRIATPRQRIAVGTKSPTCIFPGCRVPAAGCEIDHLTAWRDGGRTDLSDLNPFCQRHHHLKHQAGWTVGEDAEGRHVWSLPGGYEAVVDPVDQRPPPGPHDWSPAAQPLPDWNAMADPRARRVLSSILADDVPVPTPATPNPLGAGPPADRHVTAGELATAEAACAEPAGAPVEETRPVGTGMPGSAAAPARRPRRPIPRKRRVLGRFVEARRQPR